MRCSYFRLHTYSAHPLTPLSVSALTAFCVRLWGGAPFQTPLTNKLCSRPLTTPTDCRKGSAKSHVDKVAELCDLELWRLLSALIRPSMPQAACQSAYKQDRAGVGLWPSLAIRALFLNTGWKATELTNCPQQILVLDITPCDSAWAHVQQHASNASRACARTRGVDMRSGRYLAAGQVSDRCAAVQIDTDTDVYRCTSECPITMLAGDAIRALKTEVRSVFGMKLEESLKLVAGRRPGGGKRHTPAQYLTIHATLRSHEAHLLRAVLSKYNVGGDKASILSSNVSSKVPTAQSWCSAV